MASTLSVIVPPDQGDAVLDTLLTLYQAKAEALRLATLAYLDERESAAAVLDQRQELLDIDALLELVGWRFGPRSTAVELVGAPALVREVVHGTLAAAADAFARSIDRYERGEIELDALTGEARAIAALLSVFAGLESGAA
jgi:hypothetical protein